jgi:hypothetical protein
MAEKIKFTCTEPARLLYSSVAAKSAPKGVANAIPKYSATVGIGEVDWNLIKPIMVQLITAETGSFSGNPNDYYLACMPGKMAAQRVRDKAALDAAAARAKGEGEDKAFAILEKAEKRAAVYEQYVGILQGSSQFDIELGRLEAGKIVDIKGEAAIALAGKDLFYSGAYVAPAVSLQGFRRKTLDAKDGVTGFLQNMLFIRKGEKMDLGGGHASNSEVFGGFANYSDYDPLANAPGGGDTWGAGPAVAAAAALAPPVTAAAPPPPPAEPGRPQDPAMRHDNGNGTEQWAVNGAWDGGSHPIAAATPPPPPASPPPPPGAAGNAQPMW